VTVPPGAPRVPAPDLLSRIDAGIRERLEEAIDDACLTALVRGREVSGRPAPVADSVEDRAEFQNLVRDFLHRLQSDMPAATARDPIAGPAAREPAVRSPAMSPPATSESRAAGAASLEARTETRQGPAAPAHTGGEAVAALLRVQVALAKEMPDYWQRFDTIRAAYVEEAAASSRQRPGFLRRLLGG